MNNEATTNPLGVSDEQIAKWKHDHGHVVYIGIEPEDGSDKETGGYFKRPNNDALKATKSHSDKGDEFDAMETLFTNCKLQTSKDVDNSDYLRRSIFARFPELLIKEAKTFEKKF
jgi:hypothetical protein